MRVVALAGGFGTRLQPLFACLPKTLAPVNNKCFLEYPIENFKKYGIRDFTFCIYYKGEKIIEYFDDGDKFGIRIDYSIEELPLGTAGAIGLLRESINETFCVINADNYIDLDIKECIEKHKASNAIATIAVAQVKDTSRYGRVEFDEVGVVKSFKEKNEALKEEGYINSGFYIFEPQIFDYIPPNRSVSLEREVFLALLKDKKKINSYTEVSNFYDIGVPTDYYSFVQWINNSRNQGGSKSH
jgi:NDP-sugar pyrophosphorylase family protein